MVCVPFQCIALISIDHDLTESQFCHAHCLLDMHTHTVVSKVLLVLVLCVVYGPVFACVDTPRPLLGHVMGLVYLVFL